MRKMSFAILCLAMIAMAGTAWAELAAPNWGAGFPRLMGEKVLLMWTPVAGAEDYNVYRNGQVIGSLKATNFIDQAPLGGDNRYSVVALAGGVEGTKSQEKTVTIKVAEEVVVLPPTGLAFRLIDDGIAVAWSKPKGTILAYNVYRSLESGKGHEMVSSVQENKYIDQNVEEGKTYYYTVSVLDGSFVETGKSEELAVKFEILKEEKGAGGFELKAYEIVIEPTALVKGLNLLGSEKLVAAVDTAISEDGKVYFVDQTGGSIKVLDLQGNYLFQFGRRGMEKDEFKLPYGVGIGPDGKVYIADCFSVFVFSPEGKMISRFELEPPKDKGILEAAMNSKENKGKQLNPMPVDVVFDSKGNMLVVDNAFARVVVLDGKGNFLSEFGRYGFGEGEFKHPSYIAVNSRGEIGLLDSMNRRAQIFSPDYEFVHIIGEAKTFVGSFLGLGGIAVTREDNFAIADPPMASIQVFDRETGEYLYHFGNEKAELEPESKQRALWNIINPAGISIDLKNNNLWICLPRTGSATVRRIMN